MRKNGEIGQIPKVLRNNKITRCRTAEADTDDGNGKREQNRILWPGG